MSGFLGMRGNGDWATDQRPKNWRETILFLYPNGSMPLTAIMSKMKSEKTDDPQFYWWTKLLPTQAATVTGVYTDTTLVTAYTSGGVTGSVVYLKMAAADIIHFRVGHTVVMRDASDFTVDVVGKVTTRTANGASSYIGVKLLEADDNSSYSHDLSDCDKVMVIGNVNAEGAAMPSSIAYDPDKLYNYTQIFRTPLSITRTARRTKLRTGDQYKEAKREALELHGIEMEKAFLFGIPYEGTGDNGKPERTTEGLITCIRSNNSGNVADFQLDATYHGKNWLDDGGGDEFLSEYLEQVFRYGRQEKLAVCGTGALLGINRLAQAGSHFTMTSATKAYGINVTEWVTPFGKIYLKTHPLFNIESTLRNSMLLFEPENCVYRYIDDTNFYAESEKGAAAAGTNGGRIDGTQEEFLTEAGLEYHHPYTAAFLNGVGLNHTA
jgi:hypothetical protein